jgi:mannosidase alpha-like ER degradation enhancer 2
MTRKALLFSAILLVLAAAAPAQTRSPYADSVRAQFLHAWNGYRTNAWGHDALKPLSRTPHDWYGTSLLMTPVDAFDTMLLMGLKEEAAEAKQLILSTLSFDRNIEVQAFEIVIRLLGGLLSAYEMDGDPRLLALAKDLGDRLLPIFDSPSGIPFRYVHLQTGAVRDSVNNPAEIGTLLLEFGTLSRHTHNPVYFQKAKRAVVALFAHRSPIGLVGTWIDVNTGTWKNPSSHVSGAIDSYYEYLLKAWLLFGDEDCKRMYDEHMTAVHRYVADTSHGGLWYGSVNMFTGQRLRTQYGALDAFFPAVLALGGDLERARALQESGFRMWNLHGIEPEGLDYSTMTVSSPGYPLRPEIIESAYYLWFLTGESRYREMGETFYRDLVRFCRTETGFAHLKSVITKEKDDAMESFFFAETLKYLYLLFAEKEAFDLNAHVLNTEAHPYRKK